MLKQSRLWSFFESVTNTVVGFLLSLAINAVLLPSLGYHVSLPQNVLIVTVFAVASIARSYVLRRMFAQRGLR